MLKPDNIIQFIDPKWYKDFMSFIATGDASEEFMNLLDKDVKLQRLFEEAIFLDDKEIKEIYSKL